jgi:hypothetical protein
MRTRTSFALLICVIGLIIASDAQAWCLPIDDRQTISIAGPSALPPNIIISSDLEDLVARMLAQSATFRRQCRLIAGQQRVRVRIMLDDDPRRRRDRRSRAECALAHYEFGGITAEVRVWTREDAIELIAHELEHVLEAAEGMNYRALAVVWPSHVWPVDGSKFETSRAIQAGLRVKRDLSRARTSRSDADVARR